MSWFRFRQRVLCVRTKEMKVPTLGAREVLCEHCKEPVWLSAATASRVVRENGMPFEDCAEPWCWECAEKNFDDLELIPPSAEQMEEMRRHLEGN